MKYAAAIATLEMALDVCDTNAPINFARGDFEQAQLERENAAKFGEAIEALKAA